MPENLKTTAETRIQDILNDPSASQWLKDALTSALQRDPLAAADDAELVFEVLYAHAGLI